MRNQYIPKPMILRVNCQCFLLPKSRQSGNLIGIHSSKDKSSSRHSGNLHFNHYKFSPLDYECMTSVIPKFPPKFFVSYRRHISKHKALDAVGYLIPDAVGYLIPAEHISNSEARSSPLKGTCKPHCPSFSLVAKTF